MISFFRILLKWVLNKLDLIEYKIKSWFYISKNQSDLYLNTKNKDEHFYYNISLQLIKSCTSIIVGYILYRLTIYKIQTTHKNLQPFINIESKIISLIILLLITTITFRVSYKIFKYFYRVSEWQLILGLGMISYFMFLKLNYTKTNEFFIKIYGGQDLIDLLLILFIPLFIASIINNYSLKFNKAKNVYLEDNPIQNEKLSYAHEKIINKLCLSIFKDKYDKSFSIGIIAPWGHGKSSFMLQLKNRIIEFKTNPDKYLEFQTYTKSGNNIGHQEIVTFDFLPFLSHNENNIIQDFYNRLIQEIKFRSSSASRKLDKYSKKLISILEERKVSKIYSLNDSNDTNESISEIYKDIEDVLNKLELKFIIFIDDLDRLNSNEIIQVLKLIRNTSNFPNFVFVVALDKEYINNSLKNVNGNSNNYLNKFFQLECFLPEIGKEDIFEYSFLLIEQSQIIQNFDKERIISAIKNEIFLYGEYVKNYRDIKKIINQLIFDYNNIKNQFYEIDFKDYFNILFLKIKYPEIFKIICNQYESIFEIKKNKIFLIKKTNNENDTEEKLYDLLENYQNTKYYKPDLKSFNFGLNLEKIENAYFKFLDYDIDLIHRTIYELFNDSNDSVNSIRYLNNFYKLTRQSISENDLSFEDYHTLITSDLNNIELHIDNLFVQEKINQFIDRFTFEKDIVDKYVKIGLKILLKLDSNSSAYYKLREYLNDQCHFNKSLKIQEDIKHLIRENYLQCSDGDIIVKLDFCNYIKNKFINNLSWNFTKDELLEEQIYLFEKLIKFKGNSWKASDYEVFRAFYIFFEDLNEEKQIQIKNLIKDFFKVNDLKVLVYNLLHPDYESQLTFRLHRIVNDVFDSSNAFKDFIRTNFSKDKLSEINEFQAFLDLNIIVNNSLDIKYPFSSKTILVNFVGWGIPTKFEIDRMSKTIQVIFNLNTGINISGLIENCSLQYFTNEKKYVVISSNTNHYSIEEFIQKIIDKFFIRFKNLTSLTDNETYNISKEINLNKNIAFVEYDGEKVFDLIFLSN